MQFVTDTWVPVTTLKVRSDDYARPNMKSDLRSYEARHWLAIIGAALFALAPIVWVATGLWVSASLLVSLSLLMVSAATLLVPNVQSESHVYESGEDR